MTLTAAERRTHWENTISWYLQWKGLSTKLVNILNTADVVDVEDLRRRYDKGMPHYRNLGKTGMREIAAFLGYPAPEPPPTPHVPTYWVECEGKQVGRTFKSMAASVRWAEDFAARKGKDCAVIRTAKYKNILAPRKPQSHA